MLLLRCAMCGTAVQVRACYATLGTDVCGVRYRVLTYVMSGTGIAARYAKSGTDIGRAARPNRRRRTAESKLRSARNQTLSPHVSVQSVPETPLIPRAKSDPFTRHCITLCDRNALESSREIKDFRPTLQYT
eukprot:709404-Rhodomonas_salina.3